MLEQEAKIVVNIYFIAGFQSEKICNLHDPARFDISCLHVDPKFDSWMKDIPPMPLYISDSLYNSDDQYPQNPKPC